MKREDTEVLIVGAGPVGLFLAAELRRRGRECMLIERASQPSMHSKALALMPGTMEMFERAGIASQFVASANRVDGVRFVTPRACALVGFGHLRTAYNYVSILPQWRTEEILAQRLAQLGGEVLYAHTFSSLRQGPAGVEASIVTAGGTKTIRARFLVGCDGVHSTVREQIGVGFPGVAYPGRALLADACTRTEVPVNEARVHVYGGGVVTLFPMGEGYRRVVVISPRETLPDYAGRDWLLSRLMDAGYGRIDMDEPSWSNTFHVHRRIAEAMRSGNVFLAGDSVHTHSPVGGQGMSVGLHDAWNLSAKLEQVLAGNAADVVLDSYERERLPLARAVVRRTDLLTRALAHPHPFAQMARERIAPALVRLGVVNRPVTRALAQLHSA